MNVEEKVETENYSRDADQTRYLYIVGIIAGGTLLGLFALEMVAMFKPLGETYKALIFTPEIVHTLIPVTVGGLAGLGGFLYGRESGKREVERKMGNGMTPTGGTK